MIIYEPHYGYPVKRDYQSLFAFAAKSNKSFMLLSAVWKYLQID